MKRLMEYLADLSPVIAKSALSECTCGTDIQITLLDYSSYSAFQFNLSYTI